MDPQTEIKIVRILFEDDEIVHQVGGDIATVQDAVSESGLAFIVHELDEDARLLMTTVYPMPGKGGVLAIEIERG